jgi:hypothetical protein
MMNALGVILQGLSLLIFSGANMAKVLRRKNKLPEGSLGLHRKKLKGRCEEPALELFWAIRFVYKIYSFVVPNVHVRHVHYLAVKLPQKEIDRPSQGKRSIL